MGGGAEVDRGRKMRQEKRTRVVEVGGGWVGRRRVECHGRVRREGGELV